MRNATLLILGFFLFSAPLFGQKVEKKSERVKALEKGKRKLVSKIEEEDTFFKATKAPDIWKNESAVILFHYTRTHWSHDWSEGAELAILSRTRVLLNDQFAINDFSSFTLSEDELLDITVIKPDGQRISFDRSRAVSSDIRLEDVLPGFDLQLAVKSKIPVPNLEPGDIIEIERFWDGSYRLPPPSFTVIGMHSSAPILRRRMDFETSNAARINWKSMNGAPDLVVVKTKKDGGSYTFNDSMRHRIKGEYWNPGTMQLPYVKYALTGYRRGRFVNDVADESYEPLTGLTEDHLKAFVKALHNDQKNSRSRFYIDFVRAFKKQKMTDEEFVNNFYRYYRAKYFLVQKGPDAKVNHLEFMMIMRRVLEKRNIEFEYIVAVPRELGKLADAISFSETAWALRIKSTGQIISPMNLYSNPGDFRESIKGTEVYVIEPAKKVKHYVLSTEELSAATPQEHQSLHEVEVQIAPNGEDVLLKRTTTLIGVMKEGYNSSMPYSMLLPDFHLLFGENHRFIVPHQFYEKMTEIQYEEELSRINEAFYKEIDRGSETEMRERNESRYYNVESYEGLKVEKDGRHLDQPELVFTESMVLSGLTSRAGEYVVLDIGRLLGRQLEIIDSEDSIRNLNIYFNYPRVIRYDLKFSIPPGMKVEGAEQFNVRVDNEAGSYIVSYELRDGLLIIHAEKIYKAVYMDKKEWNKVREFVEAASEIGNKKIILTR